MSSPIQPASTNSWVIALNFRFNNFITNTIPNFIAYIFYQTKRNINIDRLQKIE